MKKLTKLLLVCIGSCGLLLSSCNQPTTPETPEEKPCEHVWGNYVDDGDGLHHHRVCTLCNEESEHEFHYGGHATCQHKAVCEACGAEYGELDEHTFDGVWHYEEGSDVHYQECSVCHERVEERHIFNIEEVSEQTLKGTYNTNCDEGNYYYKKCKCGAISHSDEDLFYVANSHDYTLEIVLENDANLVKEATCEEPAYYLLDA